MEAPGPGAVASEHPLSTAVGEKVLRLGGTAYDAVIAVSAALTVTQPHANGLGSDFFAVVDDGSVRSVNGSGRAAGAADPEVFRRLGRSAIPTFGPLASFMTPGLVAAWALLAEKATLPFDTLLEPAVRLAREGFAATPRLARSVRSTAPHADSDWIRVYGGVRAHAPLRQSDLGHTLAAVGRDRGHSFYHGVIARAIDRDMREKGGLLRLEDLEGCRAEWTTPLRIRYRGHDVYTTPPNSQGATALIWLNLLARTDLGRLPITDHLTELLRTMGIAYGYRARYIADPIVLPFPLELLDPDYPYAATAESPRSPPGGADTTAFSVSDGTVGISAIQSNYMGFGSGQTVRGQGINLNNRGAYFSLDPDHPNVLRPGKRTFHTLMAVVAKGPTGTTLLGTMGGDVQPQVHVQVLTRLIDRNEPLADAIAAPRFAYPATIYGSADLFAERGLGLSGARPLPGSPDLVGHAHGLRFGEKVEVGVDPRGDGFARPAPRRSRKVTR